MTFVRSDSKTEFLFNYRAVPIWIRVYAHGVEIRMQPNHLLVQQPVNVSIVMCERVKSTLTKLGARANNRCSRRQLCRYFFLQTQFSRQIGECLYGRCIRTLASSACCASYPTIKHRSFADEAQQRLSTRGAQKQGKEYIFCF